MLSVVPSSLVKVKVLVTQLCPTICDPMDPARLLCPWNSPGKNSLEWVAITFSSESSQPRNQTQSDSLPSELPAKVSGGSDKSLIPKSQINRRYSKGKTKSSTAMDRDRLRI